MCSVDMGSAFVFEFCGIARMRSVFEEHSCVVQQSRDFSELKQNGSSMNCPSGSIVNRAVLSVQGVTPQSVISVEDLIGIRSGFRTVSSKTSVMPYSVRECCRFIRVSASEWSETSSCRACMESGSMIPLQ